MRHFCIVLLAIVTWATELALAGPEHQPKANAEQTTKKRTARVRVREPEGFLGLKFGIPLMNQLQECPSQVYGDDPPKVFYCYDNLTLGKLGYARLENTPDLGFDYAAIVMLVDGNVEDIVLNIQDDRAVLALKLLTSRFGKPTMQTRPPDVDYAPGQRVYAWIGSDISIELSEQRENAGMWTVSLATVRYLKALRE